MILGLGLFAMAHKGMWLRASSMARPDSIAPIIQLAESLGITDIYAQVVVGGYAYYRSEILPRSQYLSRVSGPDYDPLDSLIWEASKRNIRVHAWVNSMLVWSFHEPPESTSHILYQHPEWFARDTRGESMAAYSPRKWKGLGLDGIYLDPENPGVRAWLASVCREITERYPVAGVHLDFIRYPGSRWGFLPRSPEEAALLVGPDADTLRWLNLARYPTLSFFHRWLVWHYWRLNQERAMAVRDAVQKVKEGLGPPVLLTAAVTANPGAGVYRYAQEWWDWGLDYPVVMSYTRDTGLFWKYADFALNRSPSAIMGIGFLWDDMEAEASWERDAVQKAMGPGICYFDYTALRTRVDLDKLEKPGAPVREARDRSRIIRGAFSDQPQKLVRTGKALMIPGEERDFARFLLSLSWDPGEDLRNMGLSPGEFEHRVAGDVAAFRAVDARLFPLGEGLVAPPSREIAYALVAPGAAEPQELTGDTVIYPWAMDGLARAVFQAKKGVRGTYEGPDGKYIFVVKAIKKAGKRLKRSEVPRGLLPLFLNWTIKTRFKTLVRSR